MDWYIGAEEESNSGLARWIRMMGPRRLEGVVEETAIVVGRQVGFDFILFYFFGGNARQYELTRLTG